jgi:lambda family phage minor tail protein L
MTTNADIKKDIQKLTPNSELIELYSIDATPQGGDIYYFTPMTDDGELVKFNGIYYAPLPVEVEGFEVASEGKLPRPRLRVSNVNLVFIAAVVQFNDFMGCKVTRFRTFRKYLDGQAEADPTAQFPQDIFYIERKTKQNKFMIEFELKSAIDLEGILIPKGQVLDICSLRYRRYNPDTKDFYDNSDDELRCPYEGNRYYDENGLVTTKKNDKCGKRLFDCRLRYPAIKDVLPGYFFPSVGKIGYPYRR